MQKIKAMIKRRQSSRKNILVIDPDRDFCRNVRLYLEDTYNVNTRQGVEYIDYTISMLKIDLLIIDADRADRAFVTRLDKLKATHPGIRIIIMNTCFPSDKTVEQALVRDADDLIAKPFDVDLLKSKAEQLLTSNIDQKSSEKLS